MEHLPDRSTLTPMMQQWYDCKVAAGSALLLFRMGDFYEAFFTDAERLAKLGNINLTKRSDIPMSGIPHHQLETYLDKLTKAKIHIAIAEQFGDPRQGPLERKIVRTITPGTLVTSSAIKEKDFNTIAALYHEKGRFGLAYCDITTSDMHLLELNDLSEILSEIARLNVVELLAPPKFFDPYPNIQISVALTDDDKSLFTAVAAKESLERHFSIQTLDSFGAKHLGPAITAAGALLTFAKRKVGSSLRHIERMRHTPLQDYMAIDRATELNLELFETKTSLFAALDKTATPMGGRRLRRWIQRPLLNIESILQRQEAVSAFYHEIPTAKAAHEHLGGVRDLERLAMRISSGYATPKDLVTLKHSLLHCTPFREALDGISSDLIDTAKQGLSDDVAAIASQIDCALDDDPPWRLSDGGVIREGFSEELDELRGIRSNSSAWLTDYQEKLREKYGIKNLKVAFNKISGYYIEVSRAQADLMPETCTRTQTLTNSERFTDPDIKAFEKKILSAEEQIGRLEQTLFHTLVESLCEKCSTLLRISHSVALLDVLISLSSVAHERGYVRPEVTTDYAIEIEGGRHPVVEQTAVGGRFVPNDTLLCGQSAKLTILTGPNMGGKSTYIRQTALIALLAQIGSFVPAQKARIGLVDRLFSRIGAADDLARGQSTFMVEMAETANILNNATERSLILLDEIGRGTSTCDGIAIAKAVAEALITAFDKGPRTLFATHFFELTDLEKSFDTARNAHVSALEANGSILFLHKITKGACAKSYGIHVARLAGIPPAVVSRAEEILSSLEKKERKKSRQQKPSTLEPLLLFD